MRRLYPSLDQARQAFEVYARLEPELRTLWDLCRRAAPPPPRVEPLDDSYDVDPFEVDGLADGAEDGRCAEDYFLHAIKSRLMVLVGGYRVRGPRELQSTEAYDTVYDLLLNWALARRCACCAPDDDRPWQRGDEGSAARW